MAEQPERATLASVATHAGVSRQTVSNVLHAPDVVKPKTRAKVEASIAELGYRPNLAARQMRTSRSQAIAVRVEAGEDGVSGVVLERFTHALCAAAERQNYHLVVFTADSDKAEIDTYQQLMSTLNIDGIIVVGTHADDSRVDWLVEAGIPFVAFGRPWSDEAEHSWVDVDGAAGTYQATRHLLGLGHQRIAFLGWTDSVGTGDDRESGWRRALSEAGLEEEPTILRGDNSMADGRAMADQLAQDHPEVTAVVCVSDSVAIGVRLRSSERQWSLAVIGFDNTATTYALDLSSVAQPLEAAAKRCFEILHDQLDGRQTSPEHVLLEPQLKLRSALQ